MRRLLLAIPAALALAAPAAAQGPVVVAETLRAPTVDGKEVSVEIRRPEGMKVPVILTYSPYNILAEPSPADDSLAARYIPKGYARAVADVLGTRNSSGCWDYGGPKEQQSGVDLVNFLARQPWSNGKVAMIGGSYDGSTANMVAARSQDAPGLAAIVPEAAISRWYGYAYFGGVRYSGNSQHPTDEGFDTPLAFDFGFNRTPPPDPTQVQALQDHLSPCDTVEHTQRGYDTSPDYDKFWLERDYRKDASAFRVPVLVTHGWQDFNVKQEEGIGLYAALSRTPWKGLYLDQQAHSAPSGAEWDTLLDQFFDRFLLGLQTGLPDRGIVVSQPRDAVERGPSEVLSSWPPQRTGDIELQLGRGTSGGTLGPSAGEPASFTDTGTSEEAAAKDLGSERTWLTYTSEPATTDARIAGAPALDVKVKVTGGSGHLTPTLFDVAEDGTVVPITRGFLNLKYRDGLEVEKPLPADSFRAVVQFLPQDWIVRKGHRIVLVVAGSNTAWAVPNQPGSGFELTHGGASRLLIPLVGAGRTLPSLPPITGSQRPAEALPTDLEARRRLRVTLRRGKGRRRLLITGRAPSRTSIFLRITRAGRVLTDRSVRVRSGRFKLTVKVRRGGAYRVQALLRTREGVVSKRSKLIRLR